MSCGTMFNFGFVTSSLILIAPDTSIRPLWSSTSIKRPLKALSLGQMVIMTPPPTSHASLCRRGPMKFPLRMPPICWKMRLTEISCSFSSNTCLKSLGSISTPETGVEDISPTKSFIGCGLLLWVDFCHPDLTAY